MRLLIVELSSLGDVVHAMSVVDDILCVEPAASIDWVIDSAFARRCCGASKAWTR